MPLKIASFHKCNYTLVGTQITNYPTKTQVFFLLKLKECLGYKHLKKYQVFYYTWV